MNTQRFNHLFSLAKSAKQSLDARGFLQRNKLPRVTPAEHAWLTKHHPTMARFTRLFEYEPKEYIEDVNRAASAQRPRVTEIWVGARSLSCIPGESAEHESEGLSASQMEQEDAAETTMMQTMLYHDADSGQAMIEDDETGELRPVRIGDIVQIVPSKRMVSRRRNWKTGKYRKGTWLDKSTFDDMNVEGLTDDLDQLFLEEGDDPRHQEDMSAYGSDHRWSDRFAANSELDQKFHEGGVMANTAMEDTRWQPDDLTVRRLAQNLAAKIIERRPEWANQLLSLTDEAEERLRAMGRDVRFSEDGVLIEGYFMGKQEYYGTLDANKHALDRALSRKIVVEKKFAGDERPRRFARAKDIPQAVDWDKVRDHPDHIAEIRRRKLEAERNRMKAQLVIR